MTDEEIKSSLLWKRPLSDFSEDMCIKYFRCTPTQLIILDRALRINVRDPRLGRFMYNSKQVTSLTALCFLLVRLSFPGRLLTYLRHVFIPSELLDKPNVLHPGTMSKICNAALAFVYLKYQDHITLHVPLLRARVHEYQAAFLRSLGDEDIADAVQDLGIAMVMDGTSIFIARPKTPNMHLYFGKDKLPALRYQLISAPDGIALGCIGPFRGRTHDAKPEFMVPFKRTLAQNRLPQFAILADRGYTTDGQFIVAISKRSNTQTAAMRQLNAILNPARTRVEHHINKVKSLFARVEHRRWMQPVKSPVHLYFPVGTFLLNCITCLSGKNQVVDPKVYQLAPPHLEVYLGIGWGQHDTPFDLDGNILRRRVLRDIGHRF